MAYFEHASMAAVQQAAMQQERITAWRHGVLAALFALLLGGGCGAGEAAPMDCLATPQSCAAGTTCWPVSTTGNYMCLPSKSYVALGADCALLVGLTTCGDGLICAPMTGAKNVKQNRCTTYCDDSHACPAQATCTPVTLLASPTPVAVCILPPPT